MLYRLIAEGISSYICSTNIPSFVMLALPLHNYYLLPCKRLSC